MSKNPLSCFISVSHMQLSTKLAISSHFNINFLVQRKPQQIEGLINIAASWFLRHAAADGVYCGEYLTNKCSAMLSLTTDSVFVNDTHYC